MDQIDDKNLQAKLPVYNIDSIKDPLLVFLHAPGYHDQKRPEMEITPEVIHRVITVLISMNGIWYFPNSMNPEKSGLVLIHKERLIKALATVIVELGNPKEPPPSKFAIDLLNFLCLLPSNESCSIPK